MIQLQILNKILNTKDASLIVLNNLNADYFSDYKDEFNFILNHYNKYGNVCDLVSFLDNFPNFQTIDVKEKDSYLIEELFKDYKARTLASTFKKVKLLIMDNKVDEAMSTYQTTADQLDKASVALSCVDIIQDTSRYEDYKTKLNNFNKYFVSTGLPELDQLLGGWDREEELATVIARTNNGKTWLLIKFAEAALAQGLTVGFYSGEMTAKKIGYRFDTLSGHISNGYLIHGNNNIEDDYGNYISGLKNKYSKGKFLVLTPDMINGPAGVGALRTFIDKEHLDVLFIDQHSLLEDDRKAKSPVEKADNISRDLKNLQVLKKIPIISVSQMNRTKNENESDIIDSTQIARSDRIGQDSTVVLGISRDKKDPTLFKIQIVKNRDGGAGYVISYKVDFNQGMFEYIPSDKDGVKQQDTSYTNRYEVGKDEDSQF